MNLVTWIQFRTQWLLADKYELCDSLQMVNLQTLANFYYLATTSSWKVEIIMFPQCSQDYLSYTKHFMWTILEIGGFSNNHNAYMPFMLVFAVD